jgi:hypothetical protein
MPSPIVTQVWEAVEEMEVALNGETASGTLL